MSTVAFLTTELKVGGAEVLLHDFCAVSGAAGAEFTYVLYSLRGGPLAAAFRKIGVLVAVLDARVPFDPAAAGRLARRLRLDGVDLLHCHLPEAGVVGRVAARVAGVPVVYTEHSLWDHHHPVARTLNRATIGWNARVIAVSEAVRRCVLAGARVPSHRVITIPNGIDVTRLEGQATSSTGLRRPLGIPDGVHVVGTVGSLAPVKGHRYMLAALALLRARGWQVHGVIVGRDRGELAALRRLASRLQIGNHVTFAGERADAVGVMGTFDVFVLPSVGEGMPVTLLEAMALGRPVVASGVGGVPEVLRHGREGLVVPPGNAGALADGVEALLRDPAMASRLGKKARERVLAEYTVDRMVGRYQQVHRQVLGLA